MFFYSYFLSNLARSNSHPLDNSSPCHAATWKDESYHMLPPRYAKPAAWISFSKQNNTCAGERYLSPSTLHKLTGPHDWLELLPDSGERGKVSHISLLQSTGQFCATWHDWDSSPRSPGDKVKTFTLHLRLSYLADALIQGDIHMSHLYSRAGKD